MRNLVLAIILTIWGAGIVLRGLFGDGLSGGGSYGTGQFAAFLFGFVMVGAGVRFLVKHVRA
jgi:hypothetical protein